MSCATREHIQIIMLFDSLNLPDYLLRAVEARGYQTPTAIQKQAIPLILAGHDLVAEAQTGTGKTAAFALPIIKQIIDRPNIDKPGAVSVLAIVPTRELALQIASAFKSYSRFSPRPISTIALIGGESIGDQIRGLNSGVDIVVATPGRLLDIIDRDRIILSSLHILILDEADKLLDLGFSDQLQVLLSKLPLARQNLLFSATLPEKVLTLSQRILKEPQSVKVARDALRVEQISQRVIEVNPERRRALLQQLIETEMWAQTLVFVASKRAAHNLATKLRRNGFSAVALHGDLAQDERTAALRQFRDQRHQVMVATDIACRGIDITGLSCVVNYDLPRSPADYIHRIGRTGRAGQTGEAISFVDHENQAHFKLIEKRANIRLEREQVEGFALIPLKEPPLKEKGQAPVKGKRKSKKDKLREQAAKEAPPVSKTEETAAVSKTEDSTRFEKLSE